MLVADCSPGGTAARSRPARPPPCGDCAAPSWWNGWRQVFPMVRRSDGACVRCAQWLPRAKCSSCRHGFTCRPPDLYPHRQYQLDVVAEVAAAVAVGEEPAREAAARAGASATSARRWTAWLAGLAPAEVLLAAAQRLDPDAPVGAGASTAGAASAVRRAATAVLSALEQLGVALLRGGAELVARSGLGRVLEWQHREHGEVVRLVGEPCCLSPPMALGNAGDGR